MMRPLGPNIAAMKPAIKIAKPRIRFFCFITLLVSRFIGLGKVRTEPVIRVLSNGLVFFWVLQLWEVIPSDVWG